MPGPVPSASPAIHASLLLRRQRGMGTSVLQASKPLAACNAPLVRAHAPSHSPGLDARPHPVVGDVPCFPC